MVSDDEWRRAANECYAVRSDDDIEIPENANVDVCEGGAWVEARVWVSRDAEGVAEDG